MGRRRTDPADASLAFLRLAAEPVRWQLLRELARSDRHVRELTDLVGRPQVREVCPDFPGHPGYVHWSIPDPAASGDDDRATLPAFRHVAAELDTRLTYLLAGIGVPPGRAA